VPWETTSITGDFYFRPAPPSPPPSAPPPQSPKVGSVGPAVPPPAGTFEVNHNRPGMDYKNFLMTALDPRLCQQACQSDSQCRAWTYVNPGKLNQGANARCWLKKGVPPSTPSDCCTSGAKPEAPPASPDASAETKPVTPPPSPAIAADEAAWRKIAASNDPTDFGRFLQAFPTSHLAAAAKARQASLLADQQRKVAALPPAGGNAAAQGGNAAAQGGGPVAQGGVFVLLGRWPSQAVALKNFKATQQRFRDILGDRQSNVAVENDRGRILYRNRIGPFADVAQARDFCHRLQAVGGLCFVPESPFVAAGAEADRSVSPPIRSMGKLQVPQSEMFDLDRGAVA
jgi:hypothetical protein